MHTRWLMLVVATLVATSACGGDDSEAESSRSTTTVHATTTAKATSTKATDVPDASRDQARAMGLVLTEDDLPTGWTVTPPTPDDPSTTSNDELALCTGAPDPRTVESASVDGATFNMGGGTKVTSSVRFVRTVNDAQVDRTALQSDRLLPCAERALTAALEAEFAGQEVVVEDVAVSSLEVPRVGEETVAFRGKVTLSVEGDIAFFVADVVLIFDGRGELSIEFFSQNEPFDPALEEQLIKRVGDKLAA